VAVAEELHFGRAALRLRMAQPPLSQQIRKLEAEIGVALFNRTKRRVELTEPGRTLLGEANALLLHAERAEEAVRGAQRRPIGRLAVGFAPWADFAILPSIIRRFGERHPEVHLQVRELNIVEQILALREGRLQVGFVRPPVHDRNLVFERIFTEPLVVAFPDGHRLEAHKRVPVDMLAAEPHILLPRERAPVYHDLVMRFYRDMGFTVRVRHEADHPYGILSLVAAGLGISLVPASAVTVERPGLSHRLLDPAGPAVELALAWPRRSLQPALLQTFVEIVRSQARAMQRR
jgi:DNA-binding transcriptional LysR family regulator